MKTLVLANQKGGVGKSAVACQFAHYLAAGGMRVLVIDLDHQMNSTRALAKNPKVTAASFTSSELLIDCERKLPEAAFVVVPGDEVLSTLERQPDKHGNFAGALKAFISSGLPFDACILDTNPNPDIRYGAAMIASDYVLCPIQLNQEAIDGIRALLHHQRWGLNRVKATLNTRLDFVGLLPNLVEPTPFQRINFKELIENYKEMLLVVDGPQGYACITTRTAVAEAQADGLYLADMKKTSAREALRELRMSFDAIARRMKMGALNAQA
jgi:chromosome partitioning protein